MNAVGKTSGDRYLCRKLGIEEDSLYRLRRGDYFERLEQTVEFAYERGGKGNRRNLQLINYPLLKAATGLYGNQISRALRKRYENEKSDIRSRYNLRVPYVELLRHLVTDEELPFLEERKFWKKFEPSDDDWLRDVTLPIPKYNEKFGREESRLIGIIFGDGFIQAEGRAEALRLTGSSEDANFFKDFVAPAIEDMFGILPTVHVEDNLSTSSTGEEIKSKAVFMNVGSKAIWTWLSRDLGFPLEKKHVRLPVKYCDEAGLLEGLNASMGSLKISDGHLEFSLHETDETFVSGIHRLAGSLGYNPSKPCKMRSREHVTWRLRYSRRDIPEIKFLNPRHVRFLSRHQK